MELKALELQLEAYFCTAKAFPRKKETFPQASEPHPTKAASLEFRLQGLGYLDADLQFTVPWPSVPTSRSWAPGYRPLGYLDADLQLQFHGLLQFRFKRPIH